MHGPKLEITEQVRDVLSSPLLTGFSLDLRGLRERIGVGEADAA
jgi:hypothetical protein